MAGGRFVATAFAGLVKVAGTLYKPASPTKRVLIAVAVA